jgi:hypothetical protein
MNSFVAILTLVGPHFCDTLLQEILKTYSGAFWIDSSVAFVSGNMTDIFQQLLHTNNRGVFLFVETAHTNLPVTHPQTYQYLPSNLTALLSVRQLQAGVMLLYRTRFVIKHVIRWWVYCALEEQCIAPDKNRFCNLRRLNSTSYIGCHRYDQTAVNLILANAFNYTDHEYRDDHRQHLFFIGRLRSDNKTLRRVRKKKRFKLTKIKASPSTYIGPTQTGII